MKGEESEQLVACHLYDPGFNAEPPTTADLASKYEALAEASNTQWTILLKNGNSISKDGSTASEFISIDIKQTS